jgi:hypothetical protein
MRADICNLMALFGGEFGEICDVAIGTDQEVSWVIGIEIHHNVCTHTAMNNQTLFITQRWDSAEWARNVISL